MFQEHQRRFNRRQEVVAEEVVPAELLRGFTGSEADIRAIEEAKRREQSRLRQLGDDRWLGRPSSRRCPSRSTFVVAPSGSGSSILCHVPG